MLKKVQVEVQKEGLLEAELFGQKTTEMDGACATTSGMQEETINSDDDRNSGDEVTPINSDEEDDRKGRVNQFNPDCAKEDIKFEVGLGFQSREQFQQVVADYALFSGVDIKWQRSCEMRAEAVCRSKGCPWRIHGSWTQKHDAFVVKVLHSNHICCRARRNKQATSKWLTRQYLEKFRTNPDWPISEMMTEVDQKFGIDVSKNVCYRARALARSLIMGSMEEHYQLLPTYVEELKKVYRDITFELVLDRSDPASGSRFKRIYICLEALMDGFIHGCISVIGLDDCFLKTPLGGQLLSAVGRDGNNQMFPFAWAVVESENESSWRWFLGHLMDDLGVRDGGGLIIISDQQKGLESAVKTMLPNVEHRNCARHLYANWKKKYGGLELKSLFWEAVKSTNEQGCRQALDKMKAVSVAAYDDFTSIGLHRFCRAFISTFHKCDVVDNNISECFNSFILQPRSLPIIDMLEAIRTLLMERMAKKRGLMMGSIDNICPRIRKKLEENKYSCRVCLPTHAGHMKFQVVEYGNRYVVDVARRSCSCGRWNVSGIPCNHSISCIYWLKENPDVYVDETFKRDMYMKAYDHLILPMDGKSMWVRVSGEVVLPPLVKRQAGRPKKQRKRDSSEKDVQVFTRRGLTVKCSNCNNFGHNKKHCKEKGKHVASSSEVQIRKRGRPPKTKATGQASASSGVPLQRQQQPKKKFQARRKPNEAANLGDTTAGHQECMPKLQIRRRPNEAADRAQAPTMEALICKELAQAKRVYGVMFSESTGMSYTVMPGEKIRTSYKGRFGGQFTQVVREGHAQHSGAQQSPSMQQSDNQHHEQASPSAAAVVAACTQESGIHVQSKEVMFKQGCPRK